MEEDDDAFLYGSDAGPEQESAPAVGANGQLDATKSAAPEQEPSKDQEEEVDEDDDEEEDEEESDSDLEIIVDGSAGPPAGYNARPAAPAARPAPVAKPAPSAMTSEYTPNARPGQSTISTSLANAAGPDAGSAEQQPGVGKSLPAGQTDSNAFVSIDQLPEGPPPPVPITAPRLDLDPSEQSLLLPPETVDGEPGPIIYHVDPTEFEEKPWRRPGADLTDWFNYGFNEESWKLWGEKKHSRTVERRDMEANGGRHDAYGVEEEMQRAEQHDDNSSSNYMNQVPQQQMQAMHALMGASGMSMSQEQMMAFMGMGPGGGMGGMGMPGGGMMGMPGMGGMFGQPNANQGMFANGFGSMPNLQMMQQPFQRSTPPIGNLMRMGESSNAGEGNMTRVEHEGRSGNDDNGNSVDASEEAGNQSHDLRQASTGTGEEGSQSQTGFGPTAPGAMPVLSNAGEASAQAGLAGLPRRPGAAGAVEGGRGGISIQGRGSGVPGAPTGPSKGAPVPKGPSADRASSTTLPSNVPTGPKNPGRRYNDRDNGTGVADSLDYGAGQQGGAREGSSGRSPNIQRGEGNSSSLRRQRSNDSREPSTDRDRDRERDREWEESDSRTSRRNRERTGERRGHGSSEEEMERGSKRSGPTYSRREDDRKASSGAQRYSGSRRSGEYREERRASDAMDREEDWERESVTSSSSRRAQGSRQRGDTSRRSSNRSERRRGGTEVDSGEETEKERNRSQLRADRRAGRASEENKSSASTRKRSAPDTERSPPRNTSSRRRR